MLIVTNSDLTVGKLVSSGIEGDTLAWADRLHVGRVTPEYNLDLFVEKRALVYASLGWDEDSVFKADMKLRNDVFMKAISGTDEIRLLFGRSLGDQLMLAQICYVISFCGTSCLDRVTIKVSDTQSELLEVGGFEKPNLKDFEAYRAFWLAYASQDPRFLLSLTRSENNNVSASTRRLLQEFPSCENGLSLTEAQILDAIRLGVSGPQSLYEAFQETEAFRFLMNWDFWMILDRLCSGDRPLLEVESGAAFLCPPKSLAWGAFHDQSLRLTDRGQAVLAGDESYAEHDYSERWIGGSRQANGSFFFWDYSSETLLASNRLCSEMSY